MGRKLLNKVVWLASYPRSGNTLLRTILWNCFGLRSASVYASDLGGNKKLEEHLGHIDHGPDKKLKFPPNTIRLLKTHEFCKDNFPAIYVIRDGRAASYSYWRFDPKRHTLEDIVEGHCRFGTWAGHVKSWHPWERPDTLLLRYEDMVNNLPTILNSISSFLECNRIKESIPGRDSLAAIDGRWVKIKKDWRQGFPLGLLQRFNQENKNLLIKTGYLD